jgi:putative transposase
MNSNLEAGQAVVWQDTCYVIKAIKPLLGDIVLEAKGGVERAVDIRAFYNQVASGEIELPGRQVEATKRSWSKTEQQEADFRQQLIGLLVSLEGQSLDDQASNERVDAFCLLHQHKRPSNKTIQNYRRKFKCHGFEGLIPNFSHRGGSGWAKKSGAKEVAERVLIQTFMKDDKVNLSSVATMVNQELRVLCQDSGTGEKIDRKTISRVLQKLPSSLVKEGRLDPRTYSLWNRQAVRRYDVKQPFERVEIDAKTLDVYCCDEFGNRYTELTMYAMVCAHASYPIAVYVSGGKPSEYTLLKVFEFFFSPKDQSFKDRFGIETDWVQPCGIFTVVLDNASENFSDLSLGIVRRLGIQIEYARIARGDDKPHVESFFKAADEGIFNKMPGAKKSQDARIKNRHAKAEAEACYSIEEIYRDLVKFVADVYIHRPSHKLGFRYGKRMTPKLAMDEALASFMPVPPPSLDQLKKLLLEVNRETRQLQHYGVDFEGFQFHSHALAALARERVIKSIDILFNPEDCTAIYAVHPDDDSLIRLENKTVGIPDVSFAVAKALKKAYSGNPAGMEGHDYQRVYAQMLARFTADSQRRPKIRANNKALRMSAKKAAKADIADQFEKHVTQPENLSISSAVHDAAEDDFEPAPRRPQP